MNITFDGAEKINARLHSNIDRDTTVYRSSEGTGKVQQDGFALDISGTVMDNSAYAGHGRTAEEVMQDAAQQDITARRNYMAVMSNSMSDEDFAKLQEDGFHPGSTDIETVVTIVDHIKTAMLKGGAQVAGYTDTVDAKQLKEITGSEAFAGELQKAFAEHDIPLTKENAEAVKKAFEKLENVRELSEGAEKYMIENHLPPTAENLYTARFSATEDGSRQGRGYYAAGDVSGYMAKKPESIDYQQLMPQIEKTIEEAGYPVNVDTVADAKWLIEKGIPFHKGTFIQKQQMGMLSLPETMEDFAQTAAAAIADGVSPMKADLTRTQSYLEQAIVIKEQVEDLDERAAALIRSRNLPFHLKNLFAASEELKRSGMAVGQIAVADTDNIRLLHEVRLSMTVSANARLLKKGFRIDTAPLEELLANLKKEQSTYSQALMQEPQAEAADRKQTLYQQTLYTVERLRIAPAAVSADITPKDTLGKVQDSAAIRAMQYQKAGESYETLMTAPRKDMGDSIKKAFWNVDDILSSMNQDISEENRRVVRILGYNSMEMTEENFADIKQTDALLRQIVDGMKPAAVLSMIRENQNPLEMSLEELKQYLDEKQQEGAQEIESYSRFLYQLEQKNGITEEEKSAYIGIYRLLRQVEKGDDAAVGAMLQTGAEQNLSNLLTAVRSSKKKHMDYQIDDSFGGVNAKDSQINSITEQIEKGYLKNRQQLEEMLADDEAKAAKAEYDKSLYEEVRTAMGSEEAVLRHLVDYGQPVRADYLLSAGEMLRGFSETFRHLKKLSKDQKESDALKEADFPEKITNQEETLSVYEEMADKLLNTIEKESFEGTYTAMDLRAMSTVYKQVTFMKSMAREENYEIPVEIGGNLTAINLKMIHKSGEESKVTITLETEAIGKNAAEFTVTENTLSGYGICDTAKGSTLLNTRKDVFSTLLEKEGIVFGDIRFMEKANLDLKEFSLKAEKDRVSGKATEILYKAAKAYIGYIQEISK